MTEKRRVCHIEKGPNGFGFILCCETDTTDTYVLHVLNGSPASKASLVPGDRIIEVNGLNVERESHKEVVERLQGLQSVKLMVAHSTAAKDYFSKPGNGMTVRPLENCDDSLRPKLITVQRSDDGFDFELQTKGKSRKQESGKYRQPLRGIAGHFIGAVDKGGVAHQAGLRPGHRLIEVNGMNVEKECHPYVIAKIRSSQKADLLVVDEDTDEFFQRHGVSPTSKHLNGQLEFGVMTHDTPIKVKHTIPVRVDQPIPEQNGYVLRSKPSRSLSFMKKLTMSTPDLSFGKPKTPDAMNTDLTLFDRINRRQRAAKAKREIKKQLSKLEKPKPGRLDCAKGDLYRSRQLYDETIISDDEDDNSTVTDGPTSNKEGDLLKRGAGSTSSSIDFSSNGGTSPSPSPSPQLTPIRPHAYQNNGSRWLPVRPKSMIGGFIAEERETPTSPASEPPEDLSAISFNVDLATLKNRVQRRTNKSRNGVNRAKSQLSDYGLAHQFVNAH